MTGKFPAWAPPELVRLHEELKPMADAEAERMRKNSEDSSDTAAYDPREALKRGRLYVGPFFLGYVDQVSVLVTLITDARMQYVWTNLERRKDDYKDAQFRFPYSRRGAGAALYGVCMHVEQQWLNMPKRTKAQSKTYYEKVAALATQLAELLLEDDHNDRLLDLRYYLDHGKFYEFGKALEHDGHELGYGIDGFLNEELGKLLDPIPQLLIQLQFKAKDLSEEPVVVKQPHAPNAKANFYIQHLSSYFKDCYGLPLHAHVAAIVSALTDQDVDEDRVRIFLRSRSEEKPDRKKSPKNR